MSSRRALETVIRETANLRATSRRTGWAPACAEARRKSWIWERWETLPDIGTGIPSEKTLLHGTIDFEVKIDMGH
jgi:hypothetical protein